MSSIDIDEVEENPNDGLWTHLDFVSRKLERYFDKELEEALELIKLFDLEKDINAPKWKNIIEKELERRKFKRDIKELQREYMDNVKYKNI